MTSKPHWKNQLVYRYCSFLLVCLFCPVDFVHAQSQQTQPQPKPVPEAISVKNQAKPYGKNLKVKKSGVPQFDFFESKRIKGKLEKIRVQTIPRLDVGEEREITAEKFKLDIPTAKSLQVKPIDKGFQLKPISLEAQKKRPIAPLPKLASIKQMNEKWALPALAPLKPMPEPQLKQSELNQVKVVYPSAPEIKFLEALIFMDLNRNYDLALGLLIDVQKELKEQKTEATYHLALTAQKLGLLSEFRSQMIKVLKDPDKSWQKKAAEALNQYAIEGDRDLPPILDPVLESLGPDIKKSELYQINRAKYYLEKANLTGAYDAIDQVSDKSPYFGEAQFLRALLKYRSGDAKEALESEKKAVAWLDKVKPNSDLKSAAALTLGRLYFQTGNYKEAFQSYLEVYKKHPDWPQAMIEQAWTQIMSKDYEGAAGNMFTLHTDFFKNNFAPESYVVRAVGYLNLCQFGDGAKVVLDLQKRYMPIVTQLKQYEPKLKSDLGPYETVKTLFTNPQAKTIDGLTKYFVIEWARHPSFANEQAMINSIEDQLASFDKTIIGVLDYEKGLSQRVVKVGSKITEVKKDQKKYPGGELKRLERALQVIRIEQNVSKRARLALKELRDASIPRLDQEKVWYKKKASQALRNRFNVMQATLTKTMDQAEILRYELYSGAGEHLRYQMAGGGINEEIREQLKPRDNKQMKWEFKGEVWEDELGHFRSSLKSVCPPDEK